MCVDSVQGETSKRFGQKQNKKSTDNRMVYDETLGGFFSGLCFPIPFQASAYFLERAPAHEGAAELITITQSSSQNLVFLETPLGRQIRHGAVASCVSCFSRNVRGGLDSGELMSQKDKRFFMKIWRSHHGQTFMNI